MSRGQCPRIIHGWLTACKYGKFHECTASACVHAITHIDSYGEFDPPGSFPFSKNVLSSCAKCLATEAADADVIVRSWTPTWDTSSCALTLTVVPACHFGLPRLSVRLCTRWLAGAAMTAKTRPQASKQRTTSTACASSLGQADLDYWQWTDPGGWR